jgi:hypothetical protein
MSLETIATSAKAGTRSLRATVPEGIVVYLELVPGDRLEWKMEEKDGGRVAMMRKVED